MPDTPGRRRFLNWFLGTSTGALLASVAYPVIRFLTPPRIPEKQKPIKRLATDLSSGVRIPVQSYEQRPFFATASGAYRSFITLGALRCDQDVGLHVLVETFLIDPSFARPQSSGDVLRRPSGGSRSRGGS